MAEVGVEFLESDLKRHVDVVAALGVLGATVIPGMVAGALLGGEEVQQSPATLLIAGIAPWLGVAAATCIEQRTINPIFTQERIGGKGKSVAVHKILTCQEDSETGVVGGSEVKGIKPFAKLVRKLGIDELPQVLDVLKGDAGFFGMRQVMDITLERREAADSELFKDYMYWYERGSGLIAPDAIYAHRIRRYPEDGAEAINLMKIAINFAQSQSLETTMRFVTELPQVVRLPAEQVREKYLAAA